MSDTQALAARAGDTSARWASRVWTTGAWAALAWLITAAVTFGVRGQVLTPPHGLVARLELILAATLFVASVAFAERDPLKVRPHGRRIVALAFIVQGWEIVTAKTGWLPLPFFPSPEAVSNVYRTDMPRLLDSAFHSLLILAPGFLIGALVGIVSGIAMGWSREAHYWGHPVVRVLGPLPALAWLPVALFAFPTIYAASVFLVALATALPVAVLTTSGVAQVDRRLYDVGRTLGAPSKFLIRTIAIPSALPHIFVGLFMGLSASFAVLIFAEMVGAKSGLGWYLQWAQGWAAYANLYAVLALMSALFSGLIAILFIVRGRVLRWHKDMVQW